MEDSDVFQKGEHSSTKPLSEGPPAISILVYNNDLKSVTDNGLAKVNCLARQKFLRTWKRVAVEAAPAGAKDSVFFARDSIATDVSRAIPTDYIKIDPREHPNDVVHVGDEFEISFVGMSVTPQDTLPTNNNDLLLYSLGDAECPAGAAPEGKRTHAADSGQPQIGQAGRAASMRSSYHTFSPGFAPAPNEHPFIHYDPAVDGHEVGNEPNSYVPVPATKSLYLRNRATQSHAHARRSVFMRFSVMEIDNTSDTQIRAIASLGQIGSVVGQGAVAAPYIELLSGAFNAAGYLAKKGLQNYSKPDHVLTKDIKFLLASAPDGARNAPGSSDDETDIPEGRGNFLRYGYYFFLNKNVDAKLYAQTGCSSQSVPLLLRRTDFGRRAARKNEKPYFPLTGISYVVAKVTRGCSRSCPIDKTALQQEHKQRLDSLLQMSNVMDMFSKIEKNKKVTKPSVMRKGRTKGS